MAEELTKGMFIRDTAFPEVIGEIMRRGNFTKKRHPGYVVWLVDGGRYQKAGGMSHMFDGDFKLVDVKKGGAS